jgi:outer membrane protein assembly factor BamD (BamD/ComL family)
MPQYKKLETGLNTGALEIAKYYNNLVAMEWLGEKLADLASLDLAQSPVERHHFQLAIKSAGDYIKKYWIPPSATSWGVGRGAPAPPGKSKLDFLLDKIN